VLGAGGSGGYFGGRLAESGADATFLVREGRRKILSEQGLRIESPFGDTQIAVKTVVESEVSPVYDAVILTCKAYDFDAAVVAIASRGVDRLCTAFPERDCPYRRPEMKSSAGTVCWAVPRRFKRR
jgi:ketopantoate reductase